MFTHSPRSEPPYGPGAPTSDTGEVVPIAAVTEDMLVTHKGTFLTMLEMPPVDMGAGGLDFSHWIRKHQSALDRIPPGINMQVTMQLEPRDPQPDLEYFVDRAQRWHALANDENLPARARSQAKRISAAAQQMTAFVALWFDRSLPITWRTIYTLFWKAPLQVPRRSIFSLRKDGAQNPRHLDFVPEARQALSRTHGIVSTAFREAGLPLRDLTPGEMCQIVWRGLHPATNGLATDQASEIAIAMAKGHRARRRHIPSAGDFRPGMSAEELADLLAPGTILERETCLEIDGVRMAGYYIHDFQPNRVAMVHRLANLPGGWTGSLLIEFAEPASVVSNLREREVQLSATELAKQSQGMLHSFSNQQEVAAVQQQRMSLETIGKTPVFIRFFVIRTAPNEEILQQRTRDLESLLTTIGVSYVPARYNQMRLWESALPTSELTMKTKPRNMTADSLATFFWPAQRRYSEEKGIYLGIDQATLLPIRVDPFGDYLEKTPTFLALGRPGAGKSVWLRTMMLSALIAGDSVMAIDIEGEMQPFCDRHGGRYIEIGGFSSERINVLDIPPDSDNPLEHGTKHLVAFCEAIRGSPIPKGPEWNALAEAYKLALEDRGMIDPISGEPSSAWRCEEAPLLNDVARILAQLKRPEAASLSEMLHPYTHGLYKEYFNIQTTFDVRKERLVVFGMRHVNDSGTWDDQELQVYLWQVMGFIWSEVLRRNLENPRAANHVMLDEVWALLRAPGGAAAIENIARRSRKRRAALWMASQQIGEFLEKEHGRKILSIVGTKLLMGVSPFEANRMRDPFELSDYLIDTLTKLGYGEAMLQMANAVLKVWIRSPKELELY